MRLVTWNCCRGKFAAKSPFVRELAPDVAVLQECARPADESPEVRWAGENPNQGIAVLTANGYVAEPIAIDADVPRWMVPYRITGPVEFTLLAVWALPLRGSYVRAVCLGIDALAGLISSGPTVVTGDFNANPFFDRKRVQWTYATIEARLHALGLASAYHAFHGEAPGQESRATYYHMWRQDLAYHLDYCFVPRDWLPLLNRVDVGGWEEWKGRSDHRPVIVEMGLAGDLPTLEGQM
ncbi:MAG TPA: endonuclease/exonuclease/phosphatase family protein [Longimicrobium sp.]|nr:endonuclease/exonuclease/phosphatase family protein [Longimicrobium sp.]